MYNTNINKALLLWYDVHKRKLPWREINDTYKTWLSEVMLQQTQVNTVIPYYKKWIKKYPTLLSVANSDIDDLLKLWEGLGYYSRCKNFYNACQIVMNDYCGEIPSDIKKFNSLPGVGPYIAAAVMSIAFNQSHPAIDTNINRVMFRYLGLKNKTNYNKKRIYSKLATFNNLRPGDIIQSIMDIGSSICKTNFVNCENCPLSNSCKAFINGNPLLYPNPKVKKAIPINYFIACFIQKNKSMLIVKRKNDDALGGLWELPMIKVDELNNRSLFNVSLKNKYNINLNINYKIGNIVHSFSHYRMNISFYNCEIKNSKFYSTSDTNYIKWITRKEINNYAFHKANHKLFDLLEKNNV